jgi:hypothetical protein
MKLELDGKQYEVTGFTIDKRDFGHDQEHIHELQMSFKGNIHHQAKLLSQLKSMILTAKH